MKKKKEKKYNIYVKHKEAKTPEEAFLYRLLAAIYFSYFEDLKKLMRSYEKEKNKYEKENIKNCMRYIVRNLKKTESYKNNYELYNLSLRKIGVDKYINIDIL